VRRAGFSLKLNPLQNHGLTNVQDHGYNDRISIAYSEKYHFPSLARKKSEGEGNICDFFIGFFQRSHGKIQRSLGKNLGTVATSFSALSEKHPLCWLYGLSAGQIESFPLQLSGTLTTKCTLSQAWEERPCPLWQQLTDDESHMSCVCFLAQGKQQASACWFSTHQQA
jgi:hypothetical protein